MKQNNYTELSGSSFYMCICLPMCSIAYFPYFGGIVPGKSKSYSWDCSLNPRLLTPRLQVLGDVRTSDIVQLDCPRLFRFKTGQEVSYLTNDL